MTESLDSLLRRLAREQAWEDPLEHQIFNTRLEPLDLAQHFPGSLMNTDKGCHLYHREMIAYPPLPIPHSGLHKSIRTEELTSFCPEDLVMLDIESTGGSNDPLFLIGLLHPLNQGALVELHLARHYEEEASVLRGVEQSLANSRMLVTFNGKSYDFPVINDRRTINQMEPHEKMIHLDLLHVARRFFPRHTVTNHRLVTLEAEILKRPRVGDIESKLIPHVYHQYVRNGDARDLLTVIHHNVLDLWAMYDLLLLMLEQ